jgi:hypothetical protein
MKCIIALLFACVGQAATAQFAGKLTYKIVYSNSTLVMTYWQNGNSVKVTAQSVSNSDSTQVINTQDTLLFDIQGKKTTHLVYKTGQAVIMPNTGSMSQQAMAAAGTQQSLSVLAIGAETVNGYACTHYAVTATMGHYVSRRDVWVTTSLGNPGLQVAGGYLYWTADFQQAVKLAAAGGVGVVVKSLVNMPGLMTTMNLVGVDTNVPPASIFAVPGWYVVVDRSQMGLLK